MKTGIKSFIEVLKVRLPIIQVVQSPHQKVWVVSDETNGEVATGAEDPSDGLGFVVVIKAFLSLAIEGNTANTACRGYIVDSFTFVHVKPECFPLGSVMNPLSLLEMRSVVLLEIFSPSF